MVISAMSSKDSLETVAFGSELENDIQAILQNSYLDRDFDSKWRPAKIQIVRNQNLLKQFEEKRQEYFVHGHKTDEMEEKFGFIVENNVARLEAICDFGFHAEDSDYNALGYNCMGLYLCRFVDVCLQHALVKYCGSNVIRLIMCKYMTGRQTTAIPRVASAAEFIEPTQGFDCHVSVIQPSCSDSLQNQFDRSQIYLYEINKLLQPATNPRQVLPYAIVTYTPDGTYNSSIDAEPTNAEKLASNPQLQLIIKQINARGSDAPIDSTPVPFPGSLASGVKPVGAPNLANARPIHAAGSALGLSSTVPGPGLTGQVAVGLGAAANIVSVTDSSDNRNLSEDAKLQKVISELNAKLGAEEAKKLPFSDIGARNVGGLPGTSVLNPEYMARPALSTSVPPGLVPTVGVLPASGLLNVHPAMSSAASQYPLQMTGQASLPAYSLLKQGFSGVVPSHSAVAAGFLGGVSGQTAIASRPGSSDPTTPVAAMAQYISIPNATSFFPQNTAVYPIDYIPTVMSSAKDTGQMTAAAAAAAGFYPIQAINPATGYAVVGQAVKRPLTGEYVPVPYVEKRPRFF